MTTLSLRLAAIGTFLTLAAPAAAESLQQEWPDWIDRPTWMFDISTWPTTEPVPSMPEMPVTSGSPTAPQLWQRWLSQVRWKPADNMFGEGSYADSAAHMGRSREVPPCVQQPRHCH